jgi:hypothetical protein
MRKISGFRLWGCTAFLMAFGLGRAQINIISSSADPNGWVSDYTESFEEFAPEGTTPLTSTTVGIVTGIPILDGMAAIAPTILNNGTQFSIYDGKGTPSPTSPSWGLGASANAGVYNDDGGYQGLAFEIAAAPPEVDSVTISLNGILGTYFGGYFQTAYIPSSSPSYLAGSSDEVVFTFLDSHGNQVGEQQQIGVPAPDDGQLIGAAFTFETGYNFSSVEITGAAVAMDSLRLSVGTPMTTPEPSSYAALGLGVGILALRRRKRN